MRPPVALDIAKGMIAGAVATAAVSVLMVLWDALALPTDLDIIALLAQWLGGGAVLGWIAHGLIGTVLWGGLFAVAERGLPGSASVRGILFGLGAWLLMMLVFLPWAGGGVFSARFAHPSLMIAGTLGLHVVYGWILGFVHGRLIAPAHEAEARARGYRIH